MAADHAALVRGAGAEGRQWAGAPGGVGGGAGGRGKGCRAAAAVATSDREEGESAPIEKSWGLRLANAKAGGPDAACQLADDIWSDARNCGPAAPLVILDP